MIKRYSDHAANERTFLAWVRTAIAVMAFGFVIERFDLFLQLAAPQLALKQAAPHSQTFANIAGLTFIGIGVVMIVIAGIRFRKTAKDIESEDTVPSSRRALRSRARCSARAVGPGAVSLSVARRAAGALIARLTCGVALPDDSSGNGYPLAERCGGATESRPHRCSASSQAISSRCASVVYCCDAAICASCAVTAEI